MHQVGLLKLARIVVALCCYDLMITQALRLMVGLFSCMMLYGLGPGAVLPVYCSSRACASARVRPECKTSRSKLLAPYRSGPCLTCA